MTSIALLAHERQAERVFSERHYERLRGMGEFIDARFHNSADEVLDKLREVEAVVTTWGMPKVDEAFLARTPKLRAVFYGAGTVKGFVTPEMWERGVIVSSAAPANATPVAEYTLGVILLSNKRFWQVMRSWKRAADMPGNFRRTVGVIAASLVGRELIRLLKETDLEILLYDPFVSEEEAGKLGLRKVELPELMSESDIVTLHAPNLPHLRHMINAELLTKMKDGATFINTARGALVDEAALIAEVKTGRIWAILDVTDPEPPVEGSPLYTLPNVILTPHIAGSLSDECERLGDFAIDELERFLAGQPLRNQITQEALAHLA